MRLLRRDTEDSVARRLTEAGAPRETAEAIVATLLGCGLSPREGASGSHTPSSAYPIKRRSDRRRATMMLSTPIVLVERATRRSCSPRRRSSPTRCRRNA